MKKIINTTMDHENIYTVYQITEKQFFALTDPQKVVYLELAGRHGVPLVEINALLQLPKKRCIDALQQLVKHNLIYITENKKHAYLLGGLFSDGLK